MARRLRILVTDTEFLSGLGAVRSLGRAGHRVVAGASRRQQRPVAWLSRFCSERVHYPDPEEEHLAYREYLRGALAGGDVDALLPNTEASLVAAAAVRPDAPAGVLLLLPPDATLRFTLSKYRSVAAARECGEPTPRTVFLSDGASPPPAAGSLEDLGYPLIVKTDNILLPSGRYRKSMVWIVPSRAALPAVLALVGETAAPALAQAYVPGTGAGAFLLRWDGRVLASLAHRRLHEVPYWGGWSSLRCSVAAPELVDRAQRLLAHIGYEGVAMVEYRRPFAGGEPVLMEINGRLWGSLALALHAGVDFPRLLLECHRGSVPAPQPRGEVRVGVRCSSLYPGEVSYLASVFRGGGPASMPRPSRLGATLAVLRSLLDPRVRHDTFWWSDPAPVLFQIVNLLRKIVLVLRHGRGGGSNVAGPSRNGKWSKEEKITRW